MEENEKLSLYKEKYNKIEILREIGRQKKEKKRKEKHKEQTRTALQI